MSSIPETDLARIRRWVDARNEEMPPHVRAVVRIEMDVALGAVTIFECRPPGSPDDEADWRRHEVARLRFTRLGRDWSLYWPDRNSKFHFYDGLAPTPRVARLLAEIDADPTCIFWG